MHCAHLHLCAGADGIGSWGGSLDLQGFKAAPLKNFPWNSSDLLFQHWLFLLPWVVFHLVSVTRMGKGPLCWRCFIFFLLYLRFAVYFLRHVFSSSLHLFTFVYPLSAALALCKMKSYKQPCMQILRSKSIIINVTLEAWTLINYATRCSPTQAWCLNLGAFECWLLINLLARSGVCIKTKWAWKLYFREVFGLKPSFFGKSDLTCLTCFLWGFICG